MKSAVIVFPGSNRDRDMMDALTWITGTPPVSVWYAEDKVPDVDLVVLPGGFSYGDYLRSGAIAARAPVMPDIIAKADAGVPVLGVCNGFQILTEAGLLPGALMRNRGLTFVCREVHLKIDNAETLFTRGYEPGQVIRCPVAHHDGNYFADAETLDRLEGENRIVFRYADAEGAVTDAANPNGSQRNIAGILNEAGNVLGMMPHPENLVAPHQGGTDGRALFASLLEAVAA
ncbi:phosphoribosylformylglycinamidine synthase subunit PurQ [Rhodobium gokarnense]|uniref:Phosphoribosylformylglycinamidine synthase subunit PurQ n=1 Tax=Rhodobium gokarnense TaxID=364296 RepID=A0ABT3HD75_9HYPH|nr:phosphoribosylformylglycinamidine synthase subunit PurQ [Rhodobium gokarnense]MCW2308364.1 phosphoribosylformylglycinamidine synthase [Rhodobium gokarnense]